MCLLCTIHYYKLNKRTLDSCVHLHRIEYCLPHAKVMYDMMTIIIQFINYDNEKLKLVKKF